MVTRQSVQGHTGLIRHFIVLTFAPQCPNVKKTKNGGTNQNGAGRFGRPIFATIRKSVGQKGLKLGSSKSATFSRCHVIRSSVTLTAPVAAGESISFSQDVSGHVVHCTTDRLTSGSGVKRARGEGQELQLRACCKRNARPNFGL